MPVATSNSLQGSFHYDDFHSIVDNPNIRTLQYVGDYFTSSAFFSADADKSMYRPLLLVTYALNFALGGYEVTGYHLVNVGLHAVCSLLVWGMGIHFISHPRFQNKSLPLQERSVTDEPLALPLVCGLLFAAHPLAAEPVNYISSRSELLVAAFFYWPVFPTFDSDSPDVGDGTVLRFCRPP